jgi:hypothetical protein
MFLHPFSCVIASEPERCIIDFHRHKQRMGLALSTSFFFFLFSSTSPFWWFFTSAAESERERERGVHSLASIFPFASMHRAALVVDRSTQESQNGV